MGPLWPTKVRCRVSLLKVPNMDFTVVTRRCQPFSIGTAGNRIDRVVMATQRMNCLTATQVPNPSLAKQARGSRGGDQSRPVGTESDRIDLTGMPRQPLHELLFGRDQIDRLKSTDRQTLAIGRSRPGR